jgi:type VI protein secretion system component VasK
MTDREREIQARCEAATPGPWYNGDGSVDRFFAGKNTVASTARVIVERATYNDEFDQQTYADIEFIAHARTDLPDALDEIARLRAELDAAQRRASAAVREISHVCDTCKHDLEDDEISAEICGACGRDTKWEWRGPDAPQEAGQPDQGGEDGR